VYDDVVLAACCDIDAQRAASYMEYHGFCEYYTDMHEMLGAVKPDAVCLIAPVEITADLTCAILEMGYPLILEKPPGANASETRHMMKMAEATGTSNMVAFNRRFMPLVQKSMEIIAQKGSKILDIHYRMVRHNRQDEQFATTAIHGIDLVKYMARADYKQVDFKYRDLPEYGKNVANFFLSCEMENGAVAHLEFLPMSSINTERIAVNTDKGLIELHLPIWNGCPDGVGKLACYEDGEEVLAISGADVSGTSEDYVLAGFYGENAYFFDTVRSGRKPEGDIASGLQAVEIADCITARKRHYP